MDTTQPETLHTVRHNAILIFSKVPEPGKVKTRLTPILDGRLSPEAASGLYHCMFFDVVEICCDACRQLEMEEEELRDVAPEALDLDVDGNPIHDVYDIIISTTPAENEEVMRRLFEDSGTWPRELTFIHDTGASFDEHYNDSFQQVWDMGYDTILSMGGDMPTLPRAVVVEGFQALHRLCQVPGGGIVLSPDQEMGVSLVGWTKETDFDHSGVFYNQSGLTVLPAYVEKAQRLGLPAIYLPAVVDVDTMADLRHNITLVQALEYCGSFKDLCDVSVPWRTVDALRQMGLTEVRVMPNNLRDSRGEIDK